MTSVHSPTLPAADLSGESDLASRLVLDPATADLLFRSARTTNAFTDEPVTDDEIHAAYELMRWGPTAMNVSPMRYLIVRSPEARGRLIEHLSEGNRAKTLAAPLTIVVAADVDFHKQLGVLAPHRESAAQKFAADEPHRIEMSRMNGLLQVGYFIPALRAVGLNVGPMGGFRNEGVDAEFFSENNWRSLLVLNVGHAAAEGAHHPRSPRLAPEQASYVL